jgi:hypothetical protein
MHACQLIYTVVRDAILILELDGKMVVNGEIEGIWKEMIMQYSNVGLLARRLSEETEEIREEP